MKDLLSFAHVQAGGDFAAQYSRMADEELLALAGEKGALLEVAQLALENELKKRGLNAETELVSIADPAPPEPAERADQWRQWKTAFEREEESPLKGILARTFKLHAIYVEALRLYRGHFRLFASLVIPPGLLTYGLLTARLLASHALVGRLVDPFNPSMSPSLLAALTVLNLGIALSVCVISCVGLALVAIVVNGLVKGHAVRVTGCYHALGRRWGPFLRSSLLFGFLSIVTLVALSGVSAALWLVVYRRGYHSPALVTAFTVLLMALLLAVLARAAFAIPAVMLDGTSAYAALMGSDKLGHHSLLKTWLVMMECEVTTYLLLLLMQRAESLVFIGPVSTWVPYALGIGSSLLAAVLQVPMMIAITLLYLRARE